MDAVRIEELPRGRQIAFGLDSLDLGEQTADAFTKRRRVDDDLPEAYTMPPREIYRVEAITKSDDPEDPGWAYFLELWTETGPARLHIEGEIAETDGRFEATLNDIIP